MCNRDLIAGLIVVGLITMLSAVLFLGQAIGSAYSIFGIFQSTALIAGTLIIIGVTIGLLTAAALLISANCLSGPCGPRWGDVLSTLRVVIAMLAGLLVSLLVGLIPGGAAYAGPLAMVVLLGAAGSLGVLAGMLARLDSCMISTGAGTSIVITVAIMLSTVAGFAAAVLAIVGFVLGIIAGLAGAAG